MSDIATSELSAVSRVEASYSSDSEFTLVKRVQLTNEVPSSSLSALLPTGLQNAFWKYFAGSTTIEYDIDYSSAPDPTLLDSGIQKIINGTQALNYGPTPTIYYLPVSGATSQGAPDQIMLDVDSSAAITAAWTGNKIFSKAISGQGLNNVGILSLAGNILTFESYGSLSSYGSSQTFTLIYTIPPVYTSMDVEGVIQPELDFFLHELYRYLDHLYPDHPDYEYLLTPIEINDAFYAASAIIGYAPNYRFLEMWGQSITGNALTREELKWKIRDLRSAAYRRKFAGSYTGYKSIFSSMYRHGAVYTTGVYLPKDSAGSMDLASSNLFRMFRLIDFLGVNNVAYKTTTQIAFTGLIDPSDLFSVYEAQAYPVSKDTSFIPQISFGAFIQDAGQTLLPPLSGMDFSGITMQSENTVPSGYDVNYVLHRVGLSGKGSPSIRGYSYVHDNITQTSLVYLTPRPYGAPGSFSLPISLAAQMYPANDVLQTITGLSIASLTLGFLYDIHYSTTGDLSFSYSADNVTWSPQGPITNIFNSQIGDTITISNQITTGQVTKSMYITLTRTADNLSPITTTDLLIAPLTQVASIPFGGNIFSVGDTLLDNYILNNVYSKVDIATIQGISQGQITIVTNPTNAPAVSIIPPSDTLSGGFNIQIANYSGETISYSHIFFAGTLQYTLGAGSTLSKALLTIYSIPLINPLTGENNKLTSSAAVATGNYAEVCTYDSITQSWQRAPNTYGWVDGLDYGCISTQEITRFGTPVFPSPQSFTGPSFEAWKLRASSSFTATVSPPTTGTITGTIVADAPTQINVLRGSLSTLKAENLTAGDLIYGPGLEEGTIVVDSSLNSITITPAAVRFGSFTYNVTMRRSNGVYSLPKIFDFKKKLCTLYPSITSSAFEFLWPSKTWPNISRGYLEGVVDTSLYNYPTELPQGTTLPANVYLSRNILLDLSLDRPLYHPNTLRLTGGSGQYLCLCDTPWLEYIEAISNEFKRATEQVSVGAQLNLTTDQSGLYSIVIGNKYTDPAVQTKVAVLPQNYKDNPKPSYIRLGTGVATAKSGIFVSIDDLTLPTIYGPAFYDSAGRDEALDERRRSTYRAGAVATSATAISVLQATLVSPVFESPVGEYENLLGPVTLSSQGVVSYTQGLTDLGNPTNTYHTIHSVIYAQQYKNIQMNLGTTHSLILNSPAVTVLRRLPLSGAYHWQYKGNWTPTTIPIVNQFDPVTHDLTPSSLFPQWPSGSFITNDYYVVQQPTTIGSYVFNTGDWIVYDSGWHIKPWNLLGALQPALPSTSITTPDISGLVSSLTTSFYYFIITANCTITNLGLEAREGDWLIAAAGTPANPVWILSNGQCYDNLQNTITKAGITPAEYVTITQSLINNLSATVYKYQLPRKFLAPGSGNFQFRIAPSYNALDTNGALFSLTNAPIRYDSTAQLFYIKDTALDDLDVNYRNPLTQTTVTESFDVDESLSTPDTDLQVKSSVSAITHYIQFREPKYFKNLGLVVGEINPSNPYQLLKVSGFDFPVSQISPTDLAFSVEQVQLRNNYSAAFENSFFNHCITIQGMLIGTTNVHGITAITGTDTDATFASAFASAASHLTIGDVVQVSQSAMARQYAPAYENIYYKNLLAIAGTVSKNNPNVLLPMGSGGDDIRAFTDSLNLLNPGDATNGVYILGGAAFVSNPGTLPITGIGGLYALTVASNQSTPLLWLVGGTGGQLASSTDLSHWSLISLPAAWGTSSIRKILFTATTLGSQWRIVGDGGKCAFSVDNAVNWTMDSLPASWGTTNINDITYASVQDANGTPTADGKWMIGGDTGKVAYLPGDLATGTISWTMMTLPGSDGVTIPVPAGAPSGSPSSSVTSGWGTIPVKTVGTGNQVWFIGGGNNTTGAGGATVGLLARCTNLTESPAWTFAYLGVAWGQNYVTSIAYGGGTWVIGGSGGSLVYSTNEGQNFAACTLPSSWGATDIANVTFDYGVWTLVGAGGNIATSTDGITWNSGTAPSSLGTTYLRASAAGTSSQGIEHLIVGDSNIVAYSNSHQQSSGSLVVLDTGSSGALSLTFDSDITFWTTGDPTIKTVLITLATQTSIACELVGVPTARIPMFTVGNNLVLPTAMSTTSYIQANRVFYPHLNPAFDLVTHNSTLTNAQVRDLAGYPLYSEDPIQYYLDSSDTPTTYKNSNQDPIYLCDASGHYVTGQYLPIPVTSFINYASAGVTTFSDSRQTCYTPKYTTYAQWIAGSGRLVLGTSTLVTNMTVVGASSTKVDFSQTLSLPIGSNILSLTILPSHITGTVPSVDTPSNAMTLVSNTYQVNSPVTGIYLPDGGYGTWMGFNHITSSVSPWVGDPSAFTLYPLINVNNSPVYLCNADGTYRLDIHGLRIQMQAPKYFTFQELVTALGREIDQGGCRGLWWPAATTSLPIVPIYPTGTFKTGDYFVVAQSMIISSWIFTQGDQLIYNAVSGLWTDQPTITNAVTRIDITNGTITFANTLSNQNFAGAQFLRLHMLTIASFDPIISSQNDSRLIYVIPQTQLNQYTPDRVCYLDSAYPSPTERSDLYYNGSFLNSNSAILYYSDRHGNYVDSTLTTPTIYLASRAAPQQPKYRLCQEWYMEEQYIEEEDNNPYWQYLIIKDVFNPDSKIWEQDASINYLKKSPHKTQLLFQPITDGSNYIAVQPGLQYTSSFASFASYPANYIDYTSGILTMLIFGNPVYANDAVTIQKDFEQYGISFISNFELASISSETDIIHFGMPSVLTSNYYVNTTQNFANTLDKKSAIVAITEMGIFNTDDIMIAYATFPPIIYDSSKHHLSLNVFIKQGEFSTLSD